MHPEVIQWTQHARNLYPDHFTNCSVLEVGSMFINGTIRGQFSSCQYIGIDIQNGPCVDIACTAAEYAAMHQERFSTVISCEMLEHSSSWTTDLLTMHALLQPHGLLLLTCASTGTGEHNVSECGGHYRNISKADFEGILTSDMFEYYELTQGEPAHQYIEHGLDLRFVGHLR